MRLHRIVVAVLVVLIWLVSFDALGATSPTIRGNVTQLAAVDGGTLPTASVVPGGVVYDVTTTTPYYSNGTDWNPIASSSGTGWVTALDCDFTAQGNVALDAGNGNYSICSKTFVSFNQTNTVNRPGLVSGTGLVIQPTQAPDWFGTTVTAPGFYVLLSDLIPNLGPFTRFRISLQVNGDWASNFHAIHSGIWAVMAGTTNGWLAGVKGYSGGINYAVEWCTGQATSTSGGPGTSIATPNIIVTDFVNGLAGNAAAVVADFADGGVFPSGGGWVVGRSQPTTDKPFYLSTGLSSARVFFVAQRAGSATVFNAQILRMKVEYKP